MGLFCRNRREVFFEMLLRVYVTKIVSLSGQNLSDVLFHCFMVFGGSHSAFSTNHVMDLMDWQHALKYFLDECIQNTGSNKSAFYTNRIPLWMPLYFLGGYHSSSVA